MGETIHRKKLFGGRATAAEVHAKYAFPPDAVCTGCKRGKGRLKSSIKVLWPVDELKKRDPLFQLTCESNPAGVASLLVQTKFGPHVIVARAFVCAEPACQLAASRAMAKQPSWAIIDRNDGPKPDVIISAANT